MSKSSQKPSLPNVFGLTLNLSIVVRIQFKKTNSLYLKNYVWLEQQRRAPNLELFRWHVTWSVTITSYQTYSKLSAMSFSSFSVEMH